VTYYYPETALENGVYYAEDDPSYVISSDGYYAATYYPWSSLDYFYLGYNGGYSFGMGYYSPWYFHSAFYYSPWSAWHAPYYHYSHYYAWQPYYGHHYNNYGHGNKYYGNNHYQRKGHKKNYRNDNDYRYAGNGNGNSNRGNRRGEYSDDVNKPAGRNNSRSYAGGNKAAPVKRYVSTPPSGHSSDRGMEIRSRGSKNTGKIRKQPIGHSSVTSIKLEPSSRRTTQTGYRSKRSDNSAGEVRYRAGAKQGRSRVQPIETAPNSARYAINTVPARTATESGNSGRYGSANSSGHANAGVAPGHTANQASSGHATSRSAKPSRSASRSQRSSGKSRRSHTSSSSGSRQSRLSNSSNHKSRK
jgi:hypothetical protein